MTTWKIGDLYVCTFVEIFLPWFDFSVLDESELPTPTESRCSTASPKSVPERSQKRKRNEDPLDELLLESIREMKEKRAAKIPPSKNTSFCMEIAQRLDRMSDRQSAMAKLKILQIITDMEYPPDPEQYSQSMPYSSMYYGPH